MSLDPIRVAIVLTLVAGSARAAEDLAKHYPGDLTAKSPPVPLEWTSGPGDVWSLSSFRFERNPEIAIECGPAVVVFGQHAGNAVWACVLPEKPSVIAGNVEGRGDHFTSVWMRFEPATIGRLFPNGTVEGQGPAEALVRARFLAAQRMRSSFQAGGFPILPAKGQYVLDCETSEGRRHFYFVDESKKEIRHDGRFVTQTLLRAAPIEKSDALAAFDEAWSKFDTFYAKFGLRPDVDWDAEKSRWRPLAESAGSAQEVATAIALMLEKLRDLHVWVKAGNDWCPSYERLRPANDSFAAVKTIVGETNAVQHEVAWARTSDGIGYVATFGLEDGDLPMTVDAALDDLSKCWGLVLDLRSNGGGNEALAQKVAARFVDKKKVYAQSQTRSGPKRSDLGPKTPRSIEPGGPWRWSQPVVALIGQRTMSSAESFALMLAQCPNVTTMGDRTAGASANPAQFELAGHILVNVPRWIDLDASGKPFEDVGVAPKVAIATKPTDFDGEHDPVLVAALEHLRKLPKDRRKPAHGK